MGGSLSSRRVRGYRAEIAGEIVSPKRHTSGLVTTTDRLKAEFPGTECPASGLQAPTTAHSRPIITVITDLILVSGGGLEGLHGRFHSKNSFVQPPPSGAWIDRSCESHRGRRTAEIGGDPMRRRRMWFGDQRAFWVESKVARPGSGCGCSGGPSRLSQTVAFRRQRPARGGGVSTCRRLLSH